MTTKATPRATRRSDCMPAYPCRGPKATAAPLREPPPIDGPIRARLGGPAPTGKAEPGERDAEHGDAGGLGNGCRVGPDCGKAEFPRVHLALEGDVDEELVVRVELRSDRRGEIDLLRVDR